MFRFDKEEMKKIMEVADLFKAMKDDKNLKELRAKSHEFDAFIDVVDDTASDLNLIMDYYDDYLRDEAAKIYTDQYVKQYGFSRKRELKRI